MPGSLNVKNIFALLCLLVQWSAAGSGHAQGLEAGDLRVGHGQGQIGLHMALNEECRGPATIAALDNGRLAVLDRVNHKIVVLDGATVRDVPLPDTLIEPSDFAPIADGYLVAGALGDAVLIDRTGKPLAQTRTAYDPTTGTPRLVSTGNGRYALENLQGLRVNVNIPAARVGKPLFLESAPAGGYRYTQASASEVELSASGVTGPLSSITVKSAMRITHARPMWLSPGKGALIAVQESRRLPEELAFVRLVNIDEAGRSVSEAYIRPETFSCDTVRPFARLTDGRVASLVFGAGERLTLTFLHFEPLGQAAPVAAARGSVAELIKSEQSVLDQLERDNGTSDANAIAMTSILPKAILQRAGMALNVKWLLGSGNYSRSDMRNECAPPGNAWLRAQRLNGQVGKWMIGVPYAWGGHMSEISKFSADIQNNLLASNVCTCRIGNCVNKKATGMDCSGFVSYAWRTGNYFTTASLPNRNVSIPVLWHELAPADIVNIAGSHVRLVESVNGSPSGPIVTVIESSTKASCGGVCRKTYTMAEMQRAAYKPLRRVGLLVEGR